MKNKVLFSAILLLFVLAAFCGEARFAAKSAYLPVNTTNADDGGVARVDTGLPATHADSSEEELAPAPASGIAPHLKLVPHGKNGGFTVMDDMTLTQWEKEDYWIRMHEDMPSYCKPYLEDIP